jgi:hypothetical protein
MINFAWETTEQQASLAVSLPHYNPAFSRAGSFKSLEREYLDLVRYLQQEVVKYYHLVSKLGHTKLQCPDLAEAGCTGN